MVQSDVITGVRFTYNCYGMMGMQALGSLGLPWGCRCQRASHWNTGSGTTGATLGNTSSGATGATLGLPLPKSKSLQYRLWGYWGYPGATFANQRYLLKKADFLTNYYRKQVRTLLCKHGLESCSIFDFQVRSGFRQCC